MLEGRKDPSKVGLMYLCTFTLLKLSGERSFGVCLNQPYVLTLPVDVPPFTGERCSVLFVLLLLLLLFFAFFFIVVVVVFVFVVVTVAIIII